jgi:sterol desaturase/sphingolipid hydroxylase (fatty acid hydroxylase superfamily)
MMNSGSTAQAGALAGPQSPSEDEFARRNALSANASLVRRMFYWGFIPGLVVAYLITRSALGVIVAVMIAERFFPRDRAFNPPLTRASGLFQMAKDSIWLLLKRADELVIAAIMVIQIAAIQHWKMDFGIRLWSDSWPLPVRICLYLLVFELAAYWPHRLAHNWEPLWRFHVVHHAERRMNWLGVGARFHPMETIVFRLFQAAVLILLGADDEEFAWVMQIAFVISVVVHANICAAAPVLNWVFVDPYRHWIHHSRDFDDSRRNFACSIILVDRLFGTYRAHPTVRELGVEEYEPKNIMIELLHPVIGTVAPEYMNRLADQRREARPLEPER